MCRSGRPQKTDIDGVTILTTFVRSFKSLFFINPLNMETFTAVIIYCAVCYVLNIIYLIANDKKMHLSRFIYFILAPITVPLGIIYFLVITD